MGMSLFDCAVFAIHEYGLPITDPEVIVAEWNQEYQLLFQTEVDLFDGV